LYLHSKVMFLNKYLLNLHLNSRVLLLSGGWKHTQNAASVYNINSGSIVNFH
jgi:hypothetical protein